MITDKPVGSRKYLPLWTCGVFDFSTPASRRYTLHSTLAALAFVGLSFIAATVVRQGYVEGLWRIPVALIPVAPLGLLVVAFWRYVDGLDEMHRLIQLQAIAFSFAGTFLVAAAWTLLEGLAGFPRLVLIWTVPVMAVLHSVGVAFFTRRYWQ